MYWLRKKIEPNIAKNTSVTAIDAAEKRGFLKKLTSSIGSGVWSSQRMNASEHRAAADESDQHRRRRPTLARSFDDPEQDAGERADRQHGSEPVDRLRVRILRVGHDRDHRHDRDRDHRQVDEEHRAPPEMVEQVAADERPDRDAEPGHSRPDPDRAAPLVVGKDVGQDRERRRHDERAAESLDRTCHDQRAGRTDQRAAERAEPEHDEPEEQRAAPPEPVAEAARR